MASFSTTRFVDAPPERAFDAFTDLHNAVGTVRAIQALEVLGDGPIGVGTFPEDNRGRAHEREVKLRTDDWSGSLRFWNDRPGELLEVQFDLSAESDGG